jgi:hypothetical protein
MVGKTARPIGRRGNGGEAGRKWNINKRGVGDVIGVRGQGIVRGPMLKRKVIVGVNKTKGGSHRHKRFAIGG